MGNNLVLVLREDGTYDYIYGPNMTRDKVIHVLKQIVEQIEQNCDIPNPDGWNRGIKVQ